MINFFENEWVIVAVTIIIYYLAQQLHKRTGIILLNPILITVVLIITSLKLLSISYDSYYQGSKYIEFLLKPAVVSLGIPLYMQLEKIKKQAFNIIISQLVGCILGIISVVLIAKILGASKDIIFSLAAKSVTTPIAIEITKSLGGIPPITVSVVLVVGLFGAIFGYGILKLSGVKNPIAQGLSIGNVAHAIGTAKSMEISKNYGAMSSLGLIINGVLTAIFAPYIIKVLGFWITW